MPSAPATYSPEGGRADTIAGLGAIVRERRRDLHVTQAEVARAAGVGLMFVSDLENGKETIEIGRVWKVLAVLGLDIVIRARP